MCLKCGLLDVSYGYSIPNAPWFSYSSVPQPAFLRAPNRTKLSNNTLGKRPTSYHHSPELTNDQPQKRRRYIAPEAYVCSSRGRRSSPPSTPVQSWHQGNRFVRKLKKEELENAGATTAAESSEIALFPLGNDTEFPIHPIFRSLVGLIPDIYPSLRLATRLIVSRHALPFFHSLITSPLTFLQFESQYYNIPLTHFAPSPYEATGLPECERDLTLQAILSLAPHISLQVSPDRRLAVRWAYTERTTPPQHSVTGRASIYSNLRQLFPTPAQLHDTPESRTNSPSTNRLVALNFRGTNAVINLSPCFLRTLHPHTFPTPSPAQRLRAAFMLAVTLVHELAHAIYMCRFPGAPLIPEALSSAGGPGSEVLPTAADEQPRAMFPSIKMSLNNAYEEQEPFYATQRKPELGHAWESTVFGGGKICSLASCDQFRLGLGWQRWPGADDFFVNNYRGEVVPLCRRGGRGAGKPPKWETVYVVRDAWVWKWFLREFWDSVELQGLSELGSVEKRLGARVRNYDWVDEGVGDGWTSDCSSRGRGADKEGVVRLGQPWVESESEDDEDDDDYYDDDDDLE